MAIVVMYRLAKEKDETKLNLNTHHSRAKQDSKVGEMITRTQHRSIHSHSFTSSISTGPKWIVYNLFSKK